MEFLGEASQNGGDCNIRKLVPEGNLLLPDLFCGLEPSCSSAVLRQGKSEHVKMERKWKCGCKQNPYFQVHFKISCMLRTRHHFHLLNGSCENQSCASIYCTIKWDLFYTRQLLMSVTMYLILLLMADETLQLDWCFLNLLLCWKKEMNP